MPAGTTTSQDSLLCLIYGLIYSDVCAYLSQAMAALILVNRDAEMDQVSRLLLLQTPSTKIHFLLLPLFLVVLAMASTTLLLASILLLTIKRTADGFKHLDPI